MAPTKESPSTLSSSEEQALLKADATRPSISLSRPNTVFTGEKLDKLKSNYKKWSRDMRHYLTINGLLSYILGEKTKPSRNTEPRAYENWIENDRFAFTAIAMNVSDDDEAELDMDAGSKAAWDILQERHQNEGPIRQVDLLRTALNIKFRKGTPLPQTCREICDAVDQAFAMEDFTADLFRCIAIITPSRTSPTSVPASYATYALRPQRNNTPQKTFVTTSRVNRHFTPQRRNLNRRRTSPSPLVRPTPDRHMFPLAATASAWAIQTSTASPREGGWPVKPFRNRKTHALRIVKILGAVTMPSPTIQMAK